MKTKLIRLMVALAVLALPALAQAQFTFTTKNGAITITGLCRGWPSSKILEEVWKARTPTGPTPQDR
jgi:hypothetical protein